MKLKLRATVTVKANDGDFDEDDMMSDESPFDAIDAIGVWIDNNPIEGFPEGADLDSWMVDDFEWTTMDTGGIGTNGEAKGRMSCMLPDGGGLDGQFVAYFVEGVCTRVVFSAPAYED